MVFEVTYSPFMLLCLLYAVLVLHSRCTCNVFMYEKQISGMKGQLEPPAFYLVFGELASFDKLMDT